MRETSEDLPLPQFSLQPKPFFGIPCQSILAQLENASFYKLRGKVLESTSLIIRASMPFVKVGELCLIVDSSNQIPPLWSEVVGFREDSVFLMPLGEAVGLGPNSEVIPTKKVFSIRCGQSLLGRVLNGIGEPIDEKGPISNLSDLIDWPVLRSAPNPYRRRPIDRPLPLGVRAIDSMLTIGRGQRIGLFAGSGVGKSSLMGQIAQNTAAEVVVVCLVGERGREVMEFIEHNLGKEGLQKCVVVVATSDAPSLVRLKSCFVATAIAEWFRDQGKDVLFMMDSATRFARAQREIGLALGEPPARQGYPPSVFAQIPRLMERTGCNDKGSITAIYTVLVQGGDFDEPIADEVRGILDGHIILNRSLGERGHWPAIDVLPSLSRVMASIVPDPHLRAAQKLREIIATYEKHRDLILLGAYKHGSDEKVDYALSKMDEIETFLRQPNDESSAYNDTIERLIRIFDIV